jgi:hypothetical protein
LFAVGVEASHALFGRTKSTRTSARTTAAGALVSKDGRRPDADGHSARQPSQDVRVTEVPLLTP